MKTGIVALLVTRWAVAEPIYAGRKDVSATIQGVAKAGGSCEPLIAEIGKSFR